MCENKNKKRDKTETNEVFFGIFQLPNANFSLRGGLHYIFIDKMVQFMVFGPHRINPACLYPELTSIRSI